MKYESSILLVVNPIAGNLDKEGIIHAIRSETEARNLDLIIYETTGKKDKEAIKELLKEKKCSRVLVAGGDGTISMVAECLLNTDICLGIIPAGSANGIAVNFGISDVISEQINTALSDNVIPIDTLFINEKLCLHIADLGINAELIKNYEDGGVRGKWGYFLQSIPTLIKSESPFKFLIETEKEDIKETGILLAIANANKFGTGATINPNGRINDGKFEILIFKNLDFIEIFKTIQDKPELSPEFVTIISTHKAKISCKKPAPFQIDGEFIGEVQEVSVTMQKEKLLVAVPEAFFQHSNLT